MIKRRKIKLDKKDYMRAVLTDTSPSDVPIIFSNDGFYINHHRALDYNGSDFNIVRSLYINIVAPAEGGGTDEAYKKQNMQSYPMKYKIIKNENSLRTLSLIHPRSQKNYCEVYRNYAEAISNICNKSSFSIRSPNKIGSSFYERDEKVINKYKEINIETLEEDLRRKHASSFFSYSGFDRLYKFFSSSRYFDLEKRFGHMWFVDVANCFDTIYTHTISWAVKNKSYIKDHVKFSNQFCQKIDTVMQRSNNNETNGIPIGSEFSRVFSEIIFQDIDVKIESGLKRKSGLLFGVDYEIIRYVDDYIVFSGSESVARLIYEEIEDNLALYNLYLNEIKISRFERPFFTNKTRMVVAVNDVISNFEDLLFIEKIEGPHKKTYPSRIHKVYKFEQSFINKIKIMMGNEGVGYTEVSPYVIGVMYNRVVMLIESFNYFSEVEKRDRELGLRMRDAFLIIIRIIFFFYSVSPSVPASEKVAKVIVLIDEFLSNYLPEHVAAYRSVVMFNVEELKFSRGNNDERKGFISLERLNIIISTSNFGENYVLPKDKLSFDGLSFEDVTYFDVVCLLFYFQNRAEYQDQKENLIEFALEKIYKNGFDLLQDSESTYLFLDLICCPFVEFVYKKRLLSSYISKYESGIDATLVDYEDIVNRLSDIYWFVKWKDVDLIKALERKALKRAY